MAGPGGKREGFLLQNVNVLLGGSMLGGLVLLVCLVCCCCRFTSARKPPSDSPSSYWLQDVVTSPEDDELTCDREIEHGIYTLDAVHPSSSSMSRSTGVWPSPPPPYSALRHAAAEGSTASLPTYESAVRCSVHF